MRLPLCTNSGTCKETDAADLSSTRDQEQEEESGAGEKNKAPPAASYRTDCETADEHDSAKRKRSDKRRGRIIIE